MKTEFYIDKARQLSPSQDYEFLREEGLKYIESLAHKLWTDYNAHDPGITILEVLCYAITELGYRTGFNIEDILTNKKGKIDNKSFFTAKQILTNAPVTVLDYRKALIDIEGINNAWLIHSKSTKDALGYNTPLDTEIPIYVNPKEDKLSVLNTNKYGEKLNRLPVRGLNKVVIELSDDLDLGDLNTVGLQYAFLDSNNNFTEVDVSLEFDSWHHKKAGWLKLMNKPYKIEFKTIENTGNTIKITVKRSYNNAHTLTLYFKSRHGDIAEIKDYFKIESTICDVIDKLAQKQKKVTEVYSNVSLVLQNNRNLTEDWLCIETVGNTYVGVCADIELENGFDAEEVMAHINQAIDNILAPTIPFYTLSDMLEMGKSPREIFSGPSLQHGFLTDEDVENTDLKDCIHTSDIIESIINISGVKAIKNVLLTAYDALGNPIEDATNQPWCLNLNAPKRTLFSYEKSKLLLFRDGIPFLIPKEGNLELSQGIVHLKTQNNSLKLQNPENDFAIPKGTHYQLDDYYSIQNDFPTTYAIGEGQITNSSATLRKAQAKQLKAYLLHFDQLLADFFNQLYNAKDILDLKKDGLEPNKTYFPKYIADITGVEETLLEDELYGKHFKANLLDGENENQRSFYESDATYYDRRNRVLDHLMARFGESFNNYVFMSHMMQQNANGLAELTFQQQELIDDKERFLSQYPKLSYARGLGFNYCQELHSDDDTYPWNMAIRGGYENRIAALLGINSIILKDNADNMPKNTWRYQTNIGELKFKLMRSFPAPLEEHWAIAQQLLHNITAYKVDTFSDTYIYIVNSDTKKVAKLTTRFNSEKEAQDYIPKLYQALNSESENFYLLEHILLRPLVTENLKDTDLLDVCLNDDCLTTDHADPYSFKATLILPGWLARFRNRYFRDYAEQLVREEAPAHCLIKVCWVGQEDMIAFQNTYKTWITSYRKLKAKYCASRLNKTFKKQYNKSLSELISALKALNTIYDEGTLYDCKESELDNPIILNNTSLGTLKNIES